MLRPNPIMLPFCLPIGCIVIAHVAFSRAIRSLVGIARLKDGATYNTGPSKRDCGLVENYFLSGQKDGCAPVNPITKCTHSGNSSEVKYVSRCIWLAVFLDISASNIVRFRQRLKFIGERLICRYRNGKVTAGTLANTAIAIKNASH